MIARPLIVILITDKWLPAVPIFKILLLVAFVYPVSMVMIKAITAKGRADVVLLINILKVFLFVMAIFIGSKWGINGIAVAIALVNMGGVVINIFASVKSTGMKINNHVRDLIQPLANTILMALGMYVVLQLVPDENILQVIFGIICAILFYYLASSIFNRDQMKDAGNILRKVFTFSHGESFDSD